ncbi:MAG: murein DD-endopeptidase MepM/ murein hydrolase activator NlpD [Halioglobus sp.]|jgi:murein DD-endopeptidase MepM/ murein hydrolase activator NlpD
MKVILIDQKHGGSRSIELGRWSRAVLSLCCLGLPIGMIAVGYFAAVEADTHSVSDVALGEMQEELDNQSQELLGFRAKAQRKLKALSLNLAELQARMIRLDALGEHLTVIADLEEGEFDFSGPPAVGGPMAGDFNVDFSSTGIASELDLFEAKLNDREQQLDLLGSLLSGRNFEDQTWLSGRPTKKGWISSYYGQRKDPFTGKPAMHKGIDIAGKDGSDIIASAAGVVTWAGAQSGYGSMVEISHGEGFITRYAHNKENLVKPGDMVKKGQAIALMGSSGRSTGAHVHYEVFRHGRTVDPASYVNRTQR